MKFTIETMQPEDASEAAGIERRIFTMPWSEQGFWDSLRSSDTLYLAVRLEKQMIAYCGLLQSFDEADITNVAVEEQYRNAGVGRAMLAELMNRGKERGIARFTLEVRAGNAAAIHLYEQLGFKAVGVRRNFYEKPKEDAVIMWTS